jgi:dTDP-4-amino-4,6-dideoxygalactose transaminase
VRPDFLPFHVPDLDENEFRSVEETLRSGWITTGPKVKAFEDAFAAYVGARHAIAVNSCTAALHLALDAIGLRPKDEVIIPTMTFAATAEVVFYCQAKPVLVDCESDSLNIDVNFIEQAITPRTRAIMPVHFAGHPCDMDAILDIAKRHNLAVIEDAAHAVPARYKGRMVGTIGDITCFSFYATKTITTGEGGMITTDNDDFADRIRMMRLHGISKDAWKRYTAEGSWRYDILEPGYKYNMTDVAAAMGIEQLKKSDAFHQKRKWMRTVFDAAFRDLDGIETPGASSDVEHAWHLYVIKLNLERLTIGRDRLIEELRAANIGTSVHFIPLHLHPFYKSLGCRAHDYPNATGAFDRIISLPFYTRMSHKDIDDVMAAVRAVVQKYRCLPRSRPGRIATAAI